MNVVGMRLRIAREKKGLSLRGLAKEEGVDYTLLSRIQTGKRYPPRKRLTKFARLLGIEPGQLDALIAVERRGLNPHVLLPEISPVELSHDWVEDEARKVMDRYLKVVGQSDTTLPVPIDALVRAACRLLTEYRDFEREKDVRSGSGAALCGGLYPDGSWGKDRLIVVNTGLVRGKYLSSAEKRVTVAHEAGHYVLHCGNKDSKQLFLRFGRGPAFCREPEAERSPFNSLEFQASAFGACLLLPRKAFLQAWHNRARSALAAKFEVTESFVHLRAQMLGVTRIP